MMANRLFYEAHEQRDLRAMLAIWEHSERTVCVHPGWPILRGWPRIWRSWEMILRGADRNGFIITNEAVSVAGDMAWVTLDENIVDSERAGTIAATNVFVRGPERWKLILHHGSLVMGA
jgi:hypothetical protein